MEKTGKRLDFLAGTPKPQDVVLKPALPSFPRPGSQEFAVENKDASHIAVAGYSPNDGETGSHSVVASSEKVQIQNISSGDVTKVLPLMSSIHQPSHKGMSTLAKWSIGWLHLSEDRLMANQTY
jgi:hypothetical protein